MSESYEEIVEGETYLRSPPDARHEAICGRLHVQVTRSLASVGSTRLLAARSVVQLSAGTMLRPDLALVTSATGKLWLAAEIVNARDHRVDTVTKKSIYEDLNLPRLWMIDPRYDNVEIYHGGPYGLALQGILANKELLTESLLPEFQMVIAELFGG
ncbi:MAG: Uma2 family endonuclease [Verrucomicrobiota bacterium]